MVLMRRRIKDQGVTSGPKVLMSTADVMPYRLRLRGNVYGAIIHIPVDLRDAYNGRKQIWKSLKTSDRRTANLLLAQYNVEIETEFARKRKGPSPQEYFMRLMMAPLSDPALTQDQKLEHVRTEAAKFVRRVTPEEMHSRGCWLQGQLLRAPTKHWRRCVTWSASVMLGDHP